MAIALRIDRDHDLLAAWPVRFQHLGDAQLALARRLAPRGAARHREGHHGAPATSPKQPPCFIFDPLLDQQNQKDGVLIFRVLLLLLKYRGGLGVAH